jgi:hypothetical protein
MPSGQDRILWEEGLYLSIALIASSIGIVDANGVAKLRYSLIWNLSLSERFLVKW